jgi:hypothetical protein
VYSAFGAGDREENGAKGDQADLAVAGQEAEPVDRIEGGEHRRIVAVACMIPATVTPPGRLSRASTNTVQLTIY